jgi:hypothetical protein
MLVSGISGEVGTPGTTLSRQPHESEDFAAAYVSGEEAFVVSVGQEYPDRATADTPPIGHAVRAIVGVRGGVVRKGVDLRSPAAAATKDFAVAAFRSTHHVHVAWLDRDGGVDGTVAELGSGDVGAPSITLEGDLLHVVWAQRASNVEGFRLEYATWRHGDAKPSASRTLDTGRAAAFAPSIAARTHEVALAWMEEEGGKSTVHAGFGSDVEAAIAVAGALSGGRDPELAHVGTGFALVWTEYPTAKGEVHAAALECE